MTGVASESQLVLRGPRGYGRPVDGEALVCADGFSARYDLEPTTGVISRPSHQLFEQSIVGKVVIFGFAKGGVATAWRLRDLVARGTAPAALIFNDLNPVMVQASVLAEVPILYGLTPDPVTTVGTGDWVHLDPESGLVRLSRRSSRREKGA